MVFSKLNLITRLSFIILISYSQIGWAENHYIRHQNNEQSIAYNTSSADVSLFEDKGNLKSLYTPSLYIYRHDSQSNANRNRSPLLLTNSVLNEPVSFAHTVNTPLNHNHFLKNTSPSFKLVFSSIMFLLLFAVIFVKPTDEKQYKHLRKNTLPDSAP